MKLLKHTDRLWEEARNRSRTGLDSYPNRHEASSDLPGRGLFYCEAAPGRLTPEVLAVPRFPKPPSVATGGLVRDVTAVLVRLGIEGNPLSVPVPAHTGRTVSTRWARSHCSRGLDNTLSRRKSGRNRRLGSCHHQAGNVLIVFAVPGYE